MPASPFPSMPDVQITVPGVQKLLEGINPNKACGPDQLPARVLKGAAEPLAPMMAMIFQQSLDTGTIPIDWLTANVTPIYKKQDRSN